MIVEEARRNCHGIALRLARAGASVTIVARSDRRGRGIVAEMEKLSPDSANAQHSFIPVDAFRLSSVSRCADQIKETHESINFLVQTQGMATIQGFTPCDEEKWMDEKLALHVFSRALFIRKLQPIMSETRNARSLSVLSAGMHSAYQFFKSDPALSKGSYTLINAANAAGLYNDVLCDKFAEEFPEITFMHASPGFVSTRWGTEMPSFIRLPVRALQALLGRSKEDCAEFMVAGLTSLENSGGFHLLDEYGSPTAEKTTLHGEARDFVYEFIMDKLDQHS